MLENGSGLIIESPPFFIHGLKGQSRSLKVMYSFYAFYLLFFLGIEDLCSKRDEVQRQILAEEEEKRKIQNDIRILTERLAQVNESLAQKIATRSDYDQTIAETEAAYKKVHKTFIFHDHPAISTSACSAQHTYTKKAEPPVCIGA